MVVGYAGYYVCRSDYSVAIPLLIADLSAHGVARDAAKIDLGRIASLAVLGYALGKFVSGPLADRAVSQTADGAITLGDSHEYGPTPSVFDRPEIDRLILDDLQRYLRIPTWELAERWHGVYAWHPEKPYIDCEPAPGVRIVTGVGGSGMTLSFGLAERTLA